MTKSTYILLALAMAIGALLVGCGGSSDSDSTTAAKGDSSTLAKSAAPRTKAEYIKQADLVCAKSKTTRFNEAAAYRNDHAKELAAMKPIPREEKIILAVVLPSIEEEIEALKAIEAPKKEQKNIAALIALMETGVKGAKTHPYDIELEVPLKNPFRKADIELREYGFKECRNIA
jgi:hypothetical protein